MQQITNFWAEAKGKLTVWLGLVIASASEIRESWGDLTDSLPHWHWLVWIEHHAFSALGLLVVYARVRRSLSK